MQEMITNETEFTTISEAARLLRVSVPTVWRWIESGRLPAYRVGRRNIRIRRDDLGSVVRPVRGQPAKQPNMERKVIRLGDRTADTEKLIGNLLAGQEKILSRRRGRPFKPSAPLIRQARRQRSAQL